MCCQRRQNLFHTASVALALCLACVATRLSADVVTLKTGGVLRGEIVRQDDDSVTLQMRVGTITVLRRRIASIRTEAARPKLLSEADALLREGKPDEAIAKLEEAAKRYPNSREVREKLLATCRARADALRASGSPVEADRLYKRILELSPADPDATRQTRVLARRRRLAAPLLTEAVLLADLERYREALERFDKVRNLDPDALDKHRRVLARCHAGYGRRLLEFRRYVHARSEYDRALRIDPTLLKEVQHEVVVARFSPIVREINEKGRTLSKPRWETLVAELNGIIPLERKNPHLHYALGVCYHELKRYEDAARAYARVIGDEPDLEGLPDSLAPLQLAAKNKAEQDPIMLTFETRHFTTVLPGPPRRLETEHFVIHHHNDRLARLVARGAEYYLKRNYQVFLKRMPPNAWSKKCDIYIYKTQKQYLADSRQAEWSPAMASTRGVNGILIDHHVKTYQTVENLLSSHLSHELTHIIHGAVVNYAGRMPIWLREGIAVRQEPWFKRFRMARAIRDARKDGKTMTLDEIFAQKGYPEESRVKVFYAQAYALVETLERAGTREQFMAYNHLLLQRKPLDALQTVYGLDRDAFQKRWQKHENDLIALLSAP